MTLNVTGHVSARPTKKIVDSFSEWLCALQLFNRQQNNSVLSTTFSLFSSLSVCLWRVLSHFLPSFLHQLFHPHSLIMKSQNSYAFIWSLAVYCFYQFFCTSLSFFVFFLLFLFSLFSFSPFPPPPLIFSLF